MKHPPPSSSAGGGGQERPALWRTHLGRRNAQHSKVPGLVSADQKPIKLLGESRRACALPASGWQPGSKLQWRWPAGCCKGLHPAWRCRATLGGLAPAERLQTLGAQLGYSAADSRKTPSGLRLQSACCRACRAEGSAPAYHVIVGHDVALVIPDEACSCFSVQPPALQPAARQAHLRCHI